MGFSKPNEALFDLSEKGFVKGLLLFGGTESISAEKGKNQEFLMVMDAFETPIMAYADVVLPAKTLIESEGSITTTDGMVRKLARVVNGPIQMDNIKLIADLMNIFSTNTKVECARDMWGTMPPQYAQ